MRKLKSIRIMLVVIFGISLSIFTFIKLHKHSIINENINILNSNRKTIHELEELEPSRSFITNSVANRIKETQEQLENSINIQKTLEKNSFFFMNNSKKIDLLRTMLNQHIKLQNEIEKTNKFYDSYKSELSEKTQKLDKKNEYLKK